MKLKAVKIISVFGLEEDIEYMLFPFELYKLRLKCTRKEVGQLCSQGKAEIKDNLGVAKNETNFASGFKKNNYVDLGGKPECFMAAFFYPPLLS